MLNKSHPLIYSADIRQVVVKIKKNVKRILTLTLRSLFQAIDTKYNFMTKFLQDPLSV